MSKSINETCFNVYKSCNKSCNKTTCKFNNNKVSLNCILIESLNEHTLQEVGEILDITRMRVCQIQKNIESKLEKSYNSFL
jgi:hypothetical protein